MADCRQCGDRLTLYEGFGAGLCSACIAKNSIRAQHLREQANDEQALIEREAPRQVDQSILGSIILTTESSPNLPISERLDIVTAEVVIGMHLFKDIASAFSDTFGGRSKTMQKGLREARITALSELRREANAIGADAVVAVDLDYSEISGGGKSMLFLVASGTAVKLTSR